MIGTAAPHTTGRYLAAADWLVDGAYRADDEADNEVTVVVADGQSGPVGPADYMERAAMQAQVDAALDGRDGFTCGDVDNVLYGWASQRQFRGNEPDPFDGRIGHVDVAEAFVLHDQIFACRETHTRTRQQSSKPDAAQTETCPDDVERPAGRPRNGVRLCSIPPSDQ